MCVSLATSYPGGIIGIFSGIAGIALLGASLLSLFVGGVFPIVIHTIQRRTCFRVAKALAVIAMAFLFGSCLWTFFETLHLTNLHNSIDGTFDLWIVTMAALLTWVGCGILLRNSKSS